MEKSKWYQKKSFYVPVALVLGFLGIGASYATLLGKKVTDDINPDYYKEANEELFKDNN
ncbi:hypothetical protein ACWN8P_06765 [Vagococcus salmoninarum]|uniref:hypothetical protein n=1 Tax=Vagococcus salmoninarum TaxID=2739 RepID=UPI0014770F88|nr:hypothetical protein [Vagococcus salmoninarum]